MLNTVRSLRSGVLSAVVVLVACPYSYALDPPVPAAASCDAVASCEAGASAPAPSDQQVIARIGGKDITRSDIIAQDQKAFDSLEEGYALKIRQLELTRAEERYALLKKQSDRMLDAQALALEAKARHKDIDAVLAGIKVAAVTDREAHDYFEANKARTTLTYEKLQPEITQFLANQHNTDATRRFYDGLRAKHGIVSLLEPYRLAVDSTGPARGKQNAPVTVVEFADFQCPYCRQAEETVQAVMAKHPDDVRVVFRQLPLARVHPNAIAAAKTAVCADRQGKFWPMHDAMYSDQTALSEAALKETAKRIGLDQDALAACLSDKATTNSIERDLRAADELNISSTPYFLVNGRPIKGSVGADQFEAMVAEELKRTSGNRG
jgi:predicted DsbA family dithiol-disulfide isomerase